MTVTLATDRRPSWLLRLGFIVGVPALTAAALDRCIPYRSDYLGHFLAGYGVSLVMVWLVARQSAGRPAALALASLVSIGFGSVAEATLFPLGGLDWVDVYTQSFGAVLAGVALLVAGAGDPQLDWEDGVSPLLRNDLGRLVTAVGGLALVLGVVYAIG